MFLCRVRICQVLFLVFKVQNEKKYKENCTTVSKLSHCHHLLICVRSKDMNNPLIAAVNCEYSEEPEQTALLYTAAGYVRIL